MITENWPADAAFTWIQGDDGCLLLGFSHTPLTSGSPGMFLSRGVHFRSQGLIFATLVFVRSKVRVKKSPLYVFYFWMKFISVQRKKKQQLMYNSHRAKRIFFYWVKNKYKIHQIFIYLSLTVELLYSRHSTLPWLQYNSWRPVFHHITLYCSRIKPKREKNKCCEMTWIWWTPSTAAWLWVRVCMCGWGWGGWVLHWTGTVFTWGTPSLSDA